MKNGHRHHRGYVLLVTVGLLVLASTLLVAVGRSAVDHALLARRAQEELQRRWGTISARAAVLPYSSDILSRREADDTGSVPLYRTTIRLGPSRFTLIIADEQAKANINELLDNGSTSLVEDRIRESLSGSGLGGSVSLRPSPLAADGPASNPQLSASPSGPAPWITGLGQIFNSLPPEKLTSGNSLADFGAAANITCWGSGAINIMRASEPALRLALSPPLTTLEITRLAAARDAMAGWSNTVQLPSPPINAIGSNRVGADPLIPLLVSARIDPKKRAQIAIINHSTCYSLWIIDNDGRRSWSSLFVSDASDPSRTRNESFVW